MSTDVSNLYHNFELATFILTYKCPISCPMCFFAGGPTRTEVLPRQLAFEVLEEVKSLQMPAIGIAGGEPFLEFDFLGELIQRAAPHHPIIIVVTNAYWATSLEAARQQLAQLQQRGLKRLQVSLDDQHQQFIPIERVANALQAATELDFDDIKILGSSKGNSEKFKYQLFHLQQLLGVKIDQMDWIDRPRTSHQYYEDGQQIRYPFGDLEQAEALGLPIRKPGDCLSEMMLDVNGDVYPCCNNFIGRIGSAHVTRLSTMLKNLRHNRYFRMIKEEGPFNLARHLDQTFHTGFSQQTYGNWCELCGRIFQNDQFRDLLNGAA